MGIFQLRPSRGVSEVASAPKMNAAFENFEAMQAIQKVART
jgi:hypothetical protein